MPAIERFTEGSTTGFLHVPPVPLNQGIVLTHGAGGNCQSPLLLAVALGFVSAGFHVFRFDLPFRQRRPFGPPGPGQAAEDRNGLLAALTCLRSIVSGRMLLGGHSYGGRQASILASQDRSIAEGLVLLSYPLHPPKKPDQLRTAHFAQLTAPCLFVHGTKDPFGSVEEIRGALQLISCRTELAIIENAGHDLRRGQFDVSSLIVKRVVSLFENAKDALADPAVPGLP